MAYICFTLLLFIYAYIYNFLIIHLGGTYINHHDLSTLLVKLKHDPESKFNFPLQEHEEFEGVLNPLAFESSYKMELDCDFDLHLFPFDTQMCKISVSQAPAKHLLAQKGR
jgi:hypothetical protein